MALECLTHLDVSMNQLAGCVPAEYSRLSKLQNLFVAANNLSGDLPRSLINGLQAASSLQMLDLSHYRFTGDISQFAALASANYLELSYNQFSGALSPAFGSMPLLAALMVGGNALSGGVPGELAAVTGLVQLGVQGNNLSGAMHR